MVRVAVAGFAVAVLWLAGGQAQAAAQWAPGGGAREGARVHGTVVSDAGVPLSEVRVELVGVDAGTMTDGRGRYALRGLAPGAHTLRFTLVGWGEREREIRLDANDVVAVDVRLEVSPLQLASLNVLLDRTRLVGDEARLARIPGAAHYVSRGRMRRDEPLFDDVHAVLRSVPGVNVQEEEGYGLRPNVGIRGTGVERSSKVAVLEDGVLAAPAPYSAPAAYYFPVVGRMDGVEVRKGSSQIQYGPWTTGGALNLISATVPRELRLEADVAGGSDATRRVHARAGGSTDRLGFVLETYQVRTDGFKRLDGGGDTGFDVRDYLLKARASTAGTSRSPQEVELKLGRTDERSDETYLGLTDADFRANPLRRYAGSREDVMNAEHRQYQLRHLVRAGERADLTTTLYRNEFSRNWYKLDSVDGQSISGVLASPDQFSAEVSLLRGGESEADALMVRANNRSYTSQGVQTVLGLRLGPLAAHDIELGVRYHRDDEDRLQHDDGYRMTGGRMVRTSEGAPGSQANQLGEAEAWALFAVNRVTLGRWTISPGVRWESVRYTRTDWARGDAARTAPTDERENGVDVIVPGIGVAGQLTDAVAIYGGVHKGFGPPGPGADTETRAEESVNYEFGGRFAIGSLGAQLTAFYNDYRNILGRATLSSGETGTGDLFNGGAVDVKGIEASLDYEPAPVRGLRLPVHLAYTWTDARFGSSFESGFDSWGEVEKGDRLPYLATHQVSMDARLAADLWSVGISAVGATRMRTVAGQGAIPEGSGTDSYVVLNATAEAAFTPVARVYAGLQNLTDRRYITARRPAGVRPGLPRTVVIGVRLAS